MYNHVCVTPHHHHHHTPSLWLHPHMSCPVTTSHAAMNIQEAKRQRYLLREGAPARGSPETTPCYLSIWALSASPSPTTTTTPPGPAVARRPTSVSTLPLRLGRRPATVQGYLLAGPSVWGRKSQRGLAGLPWQEPPTRCSNSGNPL